MPYSKPRRQGEHAGAMQCALVNFTLRRANRSMFGVIAWGWPPRNPVQSFMSSMAMNSTFGRSARQLERQPILNNNHVAKMRIDKVVSRSLVQRHDTPCTLKFQRCGWRIMCFIHILPSIRRRVEDLLSNAGYRIQPAVRTREFLYRCKTIRQGSRCGKRCGQMIVLDLS